MEHPLNFQLSITMVKRHLMDPNIDKLNTNGFTSKKSVSFSIKFLYQCC